MPELWTVGVNLGRPAQSLLGMNRDIERRVIVLGLELSSVANPCSVS